MDYFTYLRNMEYMPNLNQPYAYQDFGYNLNANDASNAPWILTFQEKSVQYNLNKLISGIKDAINNETNDNVEYSNLADMAPNEEQKNIILGIRKNEILHGRILRIIFNKLTGVILPEAQMNKNSSKPKTSYKEMLKEAMLGELKAIDRYREFLTYAPNKEIYNMLLYIITDEIQHAIKYQYLLLINN